MRLAAELVASVARRSPDWAAAGATVAEARALARRADDLGAANEAAFVAALTRPAAETLERSVAAIGFVQHCGVNGDGARAGAQTRQSHNAFSLLQGVRLLAAMFEARPPLVDDMDECSNDALGVGQ